MDESELCKGVPLCGNKEDLKWCKAASMWTVPENWTPMLDYTPENLVTSTDQLQKKCSFVNDTDPPGQWFHSEDKMDGHLYQCINRTDENPFSKQKNATDDTWLEWVNIPCGLDGRRCLGDKPNQCVCE